MPHIASNSSMNMVTANSQISGARVRSFIDSGGPASCSLPKMIYRMVTLVTVGNLASWLMIGLVKV
jgi:hypothetical protein